VADVEGRAPDLDFEPMSMCGVEELNRATFAQVPLEYKPASPGLSSSTTTAASASGEVPVTTPAATPASEAWATASPKKGRAPQHVHGRWATRG
jgi:hypothetical protein